MTEYDVTEWSIRLNENFKALDEAFERARRGGNWEQSLAGYAGAIALIVVAFDELPGFDADLVALSDLLLKLDELARGNNALPPKKRTAGGRPPEGYRSAILQGRAVGCVEILIRHGLGEKQACEHIARALSRFGIRGRQGEPVKFATVRDWRLKINDETSFCLKPEARTHFRQFLQFWAEKLQGLPLVELKSVTARLCAPQASSIGQLLADPALS